jgi:hypothetical protein
MSGSCCARLLHASSSRHISDLIVAKAPIRWSAVQLLATPDVQVLEASVVCNNLECLTVAKVYTRTGLKWV